MGRTDQRVRVTKMMIRRGFMELLRQKPIQSITVKELCLRAGVNRGTFYAHYTDVYDLLGKLEEEMLSDFQKAMEPFLQMPVEELSLLKITEAVFQCLKDNADLCTVTLSPYGDAEFAARLLSVGREKYMESYIRHFPKATPRQIELYYTFVSSGCIGILKKWLGEGMNTGTEELARAVSGIMAHGAEFLRGEP